MLTFDNGFTMNGFAYNKALGVTVHLTFPFGGISLFRQPLTFPFVRRKMKT